MNLDSLFYFVFVVSYS